MLTFDAEHPGQSLCPPGNAELILDILAQTGTRATFFVQGRWATAYPSVARRIADDQAAAVSLSATAAADGARGGSGRSRTKHLMSPRCS